MAEVPLFNIRDISSGLCLTTKEQAKALTLEKLNGSKIQVSAHEQATENYNYLDMSLLEGTVGYKSLDNSFFTFPKYRFTKDQLSRITTAYPDKYAAESVVIKNYAPIMSSTSNEIFIFDPERKDLDFYLAGKKIESIYSYIEKNTQFIYLTDKGEVKTIPFDRNQLLHQLSVAGENAGIIFNTANGNDTIVGFKQYKNRFEIYNGNKIFVGGEKNDTFVLNFDAHYPNESRYLDGYAGSNSIIIHQLPVIKSNSAVNTEKNSTNLLGIDKDNFTRQVGVLVNLKQEKIWMIDDHQYAVNNYDNEKFSSFMRSQRLATIKNMENVTVVANSADIIVGDARDNVLDGNLGNDRLYGGKGNDTLILTQGIADGCEGHDVYHIKRYNWQDHIEIFADDNLKYQRWDPIKGAFVFADNSNSEEIASSTNPKFRFNNGYSYNALIVIDDSHQNINQQSMVYLDYDINEIKSVFKSGNDIVIEVEIINNAKFFKNNIISNISIRLKNVYAQDEKGNYFTNHEYNVKCQNSFLLSPILLGNQIKIKIQLNILKRHMSDQNIVMKEMSIPMMLRLILLKIVLRFLAKISMKCLLALK